MKTCYWLLPCLPVLCLAVSVPRANDEDVTIRLPNGWYFESNNSAASSTSAAIVLLPSDGDPVQLGSRIMLLRESGTIYVDVPGHVGLGGFSPDGDLLLAYHTSRDGTRVALYSGTTGARLWTKEYACRQFRFSASGKVIFAAQVVEGGHCPKEEYTREVEVFSRRGRLIRTMVFNDDLVDAIMPDDGKRVVVLFRGIETVIGYRFAQPPSQEWQKECSDEYVHAFRRLVGDHFLAKQHLGHFKVLRWDGTLEYDYDPHALGLADPARSERDYMNYGPYATPSSSKILLVNWWNSDAMVLDLTTGTLTDKPLDLSPPPGFSVIEGVFGSKLLFYSPTEVRIRTIKW